MKKLLKSVALLVSILLISSVILMGCAAENGDVQESVVENENNYPTKSIQLVVPYKPGGDTDLSARVFAKYMGEELGKSVVVVNVEGAGGSVASQKVKDANPDGYTVLYWHPSFILNKVLGVVDYDHNDFEIAGISCVADTDVLVVNSNSPYKTLDDFIKAAKDNPETINYAASVGAYSYAQAVAIEQATGVTFNKVDAGGSADKTAAVLGGHLDAFVNMYGGVKDYIESDEFNVLGQFGAERSPFLADIPTLKEQGVEVVFDKFYFSAMPKGTPQEVVDTYSEAMEKVVNNPSYKADLEKIMMVGKYYSSEDAFNYIGEQFEFYNQFKEAMLAPQK